MANKHTFSAILTGLLLVISCKVNHLADQQVEFYRIEEKKYAEVDSEITTMIAPYKEKLDAEMNKVIGKLAHSMEKQQPESTLGNWFADALYTYGSATLDKDLAFAVQNYGGLRIPSLAEGNLTKGKIFELMPFDNMIAILDLDANTLKQLIDRMAFRGGWPVSAQLRYEIRNGKAENIQIMGKPINEYQTYKVLIPDYIANGGDNCDFLLDQKRNETGVLVRDAVIEYVITQDKAGKALTSQLDGRVKKVEY